MNSEIERAAHNSNCTWIIVAPPDQTITLNWNAFDIEDSTDCSFDYVSVKEGSHGMKYCGTRIPRVMTTVGNRVEIMFSSDSSIGSQGFSLTYDFNSPETMCGGHYFASGGVLVSPNFPQPYPPYKDCTWIIQAPAGHQVHLKPIEFEIEDHSECKFDYLEVR